jgi:phosphate/sulfate permease
METYYIIVLGLLFLFAISDLMVGVSNDAVNFLNSAIGAKAAPFWAIILVASAGVLFGATFSSGMMEVARSGIFDPKLFAFKEIMIIFIAVMITDVLLLDMFNSLGLPTSTTVSIVFELLGAAVAVSVLKITGNGENIAMVAQYINSDKAMLIISGILLSVIISFTIGALVQYVTRLVFTFKYERNFKYLGSVFGGLAVTSITYFLLVKGAKGSSFLPDATIDYIMDNSWTIVFWCFAGWTVLLQLLATLIKFNILKFSVLAGTFALAMAFAGNDLVNFIGVPLAGLESFNIYMAGGQDEMIAMDGLAGKVKTPTLYLLIAGMVMVITLWLSKKARTVTATSLSLSNQGTGAEQFGSSRFARTIVRNSLRMGQAIEAAVPSVIYDRVQKRFDNSNSHNAGADAPSFDMIRATINLCVAGALIAAATSLKLPLSTTYVTFMVAMGTSFADGAWGRESAVYRITGVVTVIGGWFFTAFTAFTVCAIVAYILYIGGGYGLAAMVCVLAATVVYSKKIHKKKEKESDRVLSVSEEKDAGKRAASNLVSVATEISDIYSKMVAALSLEDRKTLREQLLRVNELNAEIKAQKDQISSSIKDMQGLSIENGHCYVQIIDYLREAAHCMTYIAGPSFDHVNNHHKGLHPMQVQELTTISAKLKIISSMVVKAVEYKEFDKIDAIVSEQQALVEIVSKARKAQIKRIKGEETKTRNSMLYLNIIHESKSVALHAVNALKSYRDFVAS